MVIIDENAVSRLIYDLKAIEGMDGMYCLHLCIAHCKSHPRYYSAIDEAVQKHLTTHNPKVYYCEDGEVFILISNASVKIANRALYSIAIALRLQPADDVGHAYELFGQMSIILQILLQKLQFEKHLYQTAIESQAQTHIAKKRVRLLGQPSQSSAEIAKKRKQRKDPVLMIVEDDAFSRRLVANLLHQHYKLIELGSAEDALSTYAQFAPDLLLLDIDLPDVLGHELLGGMLYLDPEAYIVMLSGNADRKNVQHAMDLGAKGFIAKPFTREKLFQYIKLCPTLNKEVQL
jgi:two-component system chemotaxis response regulator CheY